MNSEKLQWRVFKPGQIEIPPRHGKLSTTLSLMTKINNTVSDIKEQALDQLVCQDVDLERMVHWVGPEGRSGLMVDGNIVFTVSMDHEISGGHLTIRSWWSGAFAHLNP